MLSVTAAVVVALGEGIYPGVTNGCYSLKPTYGVYGAGEDDIGFSNIGLLSSLHVAYSIILSSVVASIANKDNVSIILLLALSFSLRRIFMFLVPIICYHFLWDLLDNPSKLLLILETVSLSAFASCALILPIAALTWWLACLK